MKQQMIELYNEEGRMIKCFPKTKIYKDLLSKGFSPKKVEEVKEEKVEEVKKTVRRRRTKKED